MYKKLILLNFDYKDYVNIKEQLSILFENNIKIEYIEDIKLNIPLEGCLILVPDNESINKITCKTKGEILEAHFTLDKDFIKKIRDMKSDMGIKLHHNNKSIQNKMVGVIHNLTGKKINCMDKECQYLIDLTRDGAEFSRIFLDISTIIEISIRFKIDYIIKNENILEKYKEMETNEIGFLNMLGRINKFEKQLDIVFKRIDEGVIITDETGKINVFTEPCYNITGYKKDVIGKAIMELFPQIYFKPVLEEYIYIKEQLIKINGYDIVASIYPIVHSNKMYGLVALFKKFSDLEKKQHKIRAKLIGKGHRAKYYFTNIIGTSENMEKCKMLAMKMAKSNSSVLITGESGTGKELFAQAIHNSSNRREYQFVAINCGAFPESLLESELFGYEEGAFTGAKKGGKPGLLELAHKGTLFLDEIGEMPLKLQLRLLRILQEKEIMRIGGDRLIKVDIRVVAATNRDLKVMVGNGDFREDLYFRLNVLPLRIPPLRKRLDDLKLLINHFKGEFNSEFYFTNKAMDAFLKHNWRGNVRELRNYIEYFTNIGIRKIEMMDLPFEDIGIYDERLNENQLALIEELKTMATTGINRYIFVLDELKKGLENKSRMGRRSLYKSAKEKGVYLSENEIRSILNKLEQLQMVEISMGRSGTAISEFGLKAIDILKTG